MKLVAIVAFFFVWAECRRIPSDMVVRVKVKHGDKVDFCAGSEGLLVCTAQCAHQFDQKLEGAECAVDGDDERQKRSIFEAILQRFKRSKRERKICFCFVECKNPEKDCEDTTTQAPTAAVDTTETPTTTAAVTTMEQTTETETTAPPQTTTTERTTSSEQATTTTTTTTTAKTTTSSQEPTSLTTKKREEKEDSQGQQQQQQIIIGGKAIGVKQKQNQNGTSKNQQQQQAVIAQGGEDVAAGQQQQQDGAGDNSQSQQQQVVINKDSKESSEEAPTRKPKPIDCKVSKWTAWLPCSQSCGSGQRSKLRTVIRPQENGGRPCPNLVETENCNETPCSEKDCHVSEWATVVPCSRTCGGGRKTRVRAVIRPPSSGGRQCPELIQGLPCNEQACPLKDCIVSPWREVQPCSVTCGTGVRIRIRNIVQYPSEHAAPCPELVDSQVCQRPACKKHHSGESVDCKVGYWSSWTECSGSCGEGMKVRTRDIRRQPEGDGAPCPDLIEERSCNRGPCPEKPVDCEVSSWSEWSECSRSCGGGEKLRNREVVRPRRHGGSPCPRLHDSVGCNLFTCDDSEEIDCRSSKRSCRSKKSGSQKHRKSKGSKGRRKHRKSKGWIKRIRGNHRNLANCKFGRCGTNPYWTKGSKGSRRRHRHSHSH